MRIWRTGEGLGGVFVVRAVHLASQGALIIRGVVGLALFRGCNVKAGSERNLVGIPKSASVNNLDDNAYRGVHRPVPLRCKCNAMQSNITQPSNQSNVLSSNGLHRSKLPPFPRQIQDNSASPSPVLDGSHKCQGGRGSQSVALVTVAKTMPTAVTMMADMYICIYIYIYIEVWGL